MKEAPQYLPSKEIQVILEGKNGRHSILTEGETPQALLERVSRTLFDVEERFGTPPDEVRRLEDEFKRRFIARDFIPGIPTLTNAGRPGYESSPLASCVVVPVDLRHETAADVILSYYRQNMGSGYNLTRYEDPVAVLRWVNELSARETATGQYDRRIANMGTLHITHPSIHEFIAVKVNDPTLIYFNISVEVTDDFMSAASNHESFKLADGTVVDAHSLLQEIAAAAWACGDPGVINFDRMNQHNPLAEISAYDCAPPCGEMGLAPAETCQFGYINLANFINDDGTIKLGDLSDAVHLLTRVLDNAIEYSVDYQPTPEGQRMARLKRKIGISVAGLADALIKAGVPYDSEEGRLLARDLMALINYQAKLASVELAIHRGSCTAMDLPIGNQYYDGYLARRFKSQPTRTVSAEQWQELDEEIRETRKLRNIHHTALPPGGRASMVLGVNHSMEPLFSPASLHVDTIGLVLETIADGLDDNILDPDIQGLLNSAMESGTFQDLPLTDSAKSLLRTAIEIEPEGHLRMVAALAGINGVSDESASKTVNVPRYATENEILEIYMLAHELGLKNISIYRDGSLNDQPRHLS